MGIGIHRREYKMGWRCCSVSSMSDDQSKKSGSARKIEELWQGAKEDPSFAQAAANSKGNKSTKSSASDSQKKENKGK